jgi:hypothetical protein
MTMFRSMMMAVPMVLAAGFAQAVDAPPAMKAFVESDVMAWAQSPQVIEAVRAQNAAHAGISADEVIARDTQWRAEVGAPDQPLIQSVMSAPLSGFLSEQVAASSGRITEVFVMDASGLNVASSGITSDYWQGDEAKFQMTYEVGPDAVFVDAIEFDDSTQSYAGQVSISLKDPATGEVIGAMTIGLNAEMFF